LRVAQDQAPFRGTCVGIDVGAERLHCVGLDDELRVEQVALVPAAEIEELSASLATSGATVAVDAPAQVSAAPHRSDASLSPKFALGRCAEIALGKEFGSWVPWVAPMERPLTGWMATGFALYEALASRGIETIEVYPYAGYRELLGRARLPRKQTVEGVVARIDALLKVGVRVEWPEMWSHDGLDALLAAVIARDHRAGRAQRASCGHDESAIWLPAQA
jgi:predicted nuclease with RNAse H fold